jgi:hypothetical protein
MEILNSLDGVLTVLGVISPFALGAAGVAVNKAIFYLKAASQARDMAEEFKIANKTIYNKIQADPDKQELAKVLSGGVKKIEALTGLDL